MEWTPSQREAIETIGKDLCVDAGAGSGKTATLVERIIFLIEHRHATLDEIVAITFTTKAAGEMKERLRKAFHQRSQATSAEDAQRWRSLEREADSARISTIHSFCHSILQENAVFCGRDPEVALMNETESPLLIAETCTAAVHALLDAEDAAAVRLAVAFGIRKLDAMMIALYDKRSLFLNPAFARNSDTPEDLMADWHIRSATHFKVILAALPRARVIRDFVSALRFFDGECGDDSDGREAFRQYLLERLRTLQEASTAEEVESVLRGVAASKVGNFGKGSSKNWTPDGWKAIEPLETKIVKTCAGLLPPVFDVEAEKKAARHVVDLFAVFQKVAEHIAREKSSRITVDFEDVILDTIGVFRAYPSVLKRVAQGIRFLLIDEFQDTDRIQLEIAERVTGKHDGFDGPELFIVGDAKQSIYRFRGAEVEVFRSARASTQGAIRLADNFRSTAGILAFIADFFERTDLLSQTLDSPNEVVMPPHRESVPDAPSVTFLQADGLRDGAALSTLDARRLEADLLADHLLAIGTGRDPVMIEDKAAGFGDMAILFRTYGQLHLYTQALAKRNIPYVVSSGRGFYQQPEIIDLRNLLTVLVDAWDGPALVAWLRGPLVGLTDNSLLELSRRTHLTEVLHRGPILEDAEQQARLNAALEIVTYLRARLTLSLPDFLRALFEQTQIEAILSTGFRGSQRVENLRKVQQLALELTRTRPVSVHVFAAHLVEMARKEQREGEAVVTASDAVNIMTIHKSKGLEFPIVALPDLIHPKGSGRDPGIYLHGALGIGLKAPDDGPVSAIGECVKRENARQEEAESARVLYVALTRARDHLVLSTPPKYKGQATSGTWWHAFDEAFDLSSRTDGNILRQDGWMGVVRRQALPGGAALLSQDASRPAATMDSLARRIARVPAPARDAISVSSLLDLLHPYAPDTAIVRTASDSSTHATQFGTLVHRLFELWNGADDLAEGIDAVLAESSLGAAAEAELRIRAQRLLDELDTRLVAPFIDQGARRELPFLLPLGDQFLSGTIDLLTGDNVIVDYKTGKRSQHGNERYAAQLQLYAAALQAATDHLPTGAKLIYVEEGAGFVQDVDVTAAAVEHTIQRAKDEIAHAFGL